MTRTTTSALNTALALPVTAVGYLVSLTLDVSPENIQRWTDLGTMTYDGKTWTGYDLKVHGFSQVLEGMSTESITVTIENVDSGLSAILLSYTLHNAPASIYQVARGVVASGDAPKLADLRVDSADIGLDYVYLRLIAGQARYAFAPAKRVDAAHGLARAVPVGTQIPWGYGWIVIER